MKCQYCVDELHLKATKEIGLSTAQRMGLTSMTKIDMQLLSNILTPRVMELPEAVCCCNASYGKMIPSCLYHWLLNQ